MPVTAASGSSLALGARGARAIFGTICATFFHLGTILGTHTSEFPASGGLKTSVGWEKSGSQPKNSLPPGPRAGQLAGKKNIIHFFFPRVCTLNNATLVAADGKAL